LFSNPEGVRVQGAAKARRMLSVTGLTVASRPAVYVEGKVISKRYQKKKKKKNRKEKEKEKEKRGRIC
jgi:hypothetical protein